MEEYISKGFIEDNVTVLELPVRIRRDAEEWGVREAERSKEECAKEEGVDGVEVWVTEGSEKSSTEDAE